MVQEQPQPSRSGAGGLVNRAVIRRCVIAAVLALPGTMYDKAGGSIAHVLASAVVCCITMVVATMPLALVTSSARFRELCATKGNGRLNPALVAFIVLAGAGIVIGILHGMIIVPASFSHVLVLIVLAIVEMHIAREVRASTLPFSKRSSIDALAMVVGVSYGATAGATSVPYTIIACAISIAGSMVTRGLVTWYSSDEHGRVVSSGSLLLIISAGASIVSVMMATMVLPMTYFAIASTSCSLVAAFFLKKLDQGEPVRLYVRRLVTLSMFLEVVALFLSSA